VVLAFSGLLARGWLALLVTVAPVFVAGVYLFYFSYCARARLGARRIAYL
jgi:hypothetical protein